MKMNGKVMTVKEGMTVEELLHQEGYRLGRIAVERNGEILPKSQYAATRVEKDDVYEIVNFVGGG